MRIANIHDLKAARISGLADLYPADRVRIGLGLGSCGLACGGADVMAALQSAAPEADVVRVGCLGLCEAEPLLDVLRPGRPRLVYAKVDPARAVEIAQAAVAGRDDVKGAIFQMSNMQNILENTSHELSQNAFDGLPEYEAHPFFKHQLKIALRNCGVINLEHIEEYFARGGYAALAQALCSMQRKNVIAEVVKSGLRGRGGGGFSTGRKWESSAGVAAQQKVVICNADEGNPGAYMDRSIMEGDPHSVIEGMAIGAYAIGANEGYVYIRTEYPLAVTQVEYAISQARECGLLGKNILGSGFDFDIHIARGSGAFVCGESSALIASIEGGPGEPRTKYVHMAESGLWGRPTVLNNVETWANVPAIIMRGADWFASVGTRTNTGTKVFSLVGNVRTPGLVEVPMGMPLRIIVNEIGGGVPPGRRLKAVQIGGPSGGCMPEKLLDLPVDYDSLMDAGFMMGAGGMIVMDDRACMVDVARYFIEFLADESCGKCTSCREGLRHMSEVLNRICNGAGQEEDLTLLNDLCDVIANASLCGLGTSAPNPVLSSLRYFREEYERHIRDRKCPAGVCGALIVYGINQEKCTGCELCKNACQVAAIAGERRKPHVLDTSLCIKCGKCFEVCRFGAVTVE